MILAIDRLSCDASGRSLVRECTFAVEAGEHVALVGTNGAGKTTLLRALAGLRPYRGSARIEGREVASMSATQRAEAVGYVAQRLQTEACVSVRQLLLFARYGHTSTAWEPSKADRDAVAQLIAELDLEKIADRELPVLSGGEFQRVMIAAALVRSPRLLLLDEPTSALDPGAKFDVWRLLSDLRRKTATTILVATHDIQTATQFATRVVALHSGSAIVDGPISLLLDPPTLYRIFERPLGVDSRNFPIGAE